MDMYDMSMFVGDDGIKASIYADNKDRMPYLRIHPGRSSYAAPKLIFFFKNEKQLINFAESIIEEIKNYLNQKGINKEA